MGQRESPNIIITGTPGCGKSAHASLLASLVPELRHLDVSQFAKENHLLDSFDEERNSHTIDEDRLLDALEPLADKGGLVIDWHCCDIFPERWIDLVVVLTCDNTILYERLEKRGYAQSKISENVECEIMQIVLSEARDSYKPEIVVVLESKDANEMEDNVDRITQWAENWHEINPNGVDNEL
ncbi:nucleoside-triphosphatase [Martiniozyma asiatica (nom. inval.)]|nr:nucleoside-triphosphatase [Martiniozyma asiatica]